MKSFLIGLLGAGFLVLLFLFVSSQYSDYRAAAESSSWLAKVKTIQGEIEKNAVSRGSLAGVGKDVDQKILRQMNLDFFEITDSGAIILRGSRYGQLIALIPSVADGKVEWRCVGGPSGDVPKKCD
jgi:hypothetical protein